MPVCCALCGRPLKRRDITAGLTSRSRFTGNRFCPQSDYKRCKTLHDKQRCIAKARVAK